MGLTYIALEHLARRGLASGATLLSKRGEPNAPELKLPIWSSILLFLAFSSFIVLMTLVQYSLRHVVGTLTMIETPSAAITITPVPAIPAEEPDAPPLKQHQVPLLEAGTPSITVVHTKPITSKIRTTIRHITAQAGFFARWRGFVGFILYNIVFGLLYSVARAALPKFVLCEILASTVAAALSAPVHIAWTHAVISLPSSKGLLSRVTSVAWRQIAIPAAICASLPQIVIYLSLQVFQLLHLADRKPEYRGAAWISSVTGFFILHICFMLFVTLPAMVTYIRIEASLLPEDDETIVPFDRSFGGKVVPRILGGTGAVGFVEAWRSFNWEARRRILKLFAKIFGIVISMIIIYAFAVGLLLALTAGPDADKFIDGWRKAVGGNM